MRKFAALLLAAFVVAGCKDDRILAEIDYFRSKEENSLGANRVHAFRAEAEATEDQIVSELLELKVSPGFATIGVVYSSNSPNFPEYTLTLAGSFYNSIKIVHVGIMKDWTYKIHKNGANGFAEVMYQAPNGELREVWSSH